MAEGEGRGIDRRTLLQRAGAVGALGATGALGSLVDAGAASAAGIVNGGKATLATVDTPVNLDCADGQLYSSIQVYQNIYAALVYMNQRFGFDPGLAHSWKQDNEKTWTFDLVDTTWHNGEPFTSADVAFTFQRFKSHPLGSFTSAVARVQPLGKHRVRFHLKQPFGAFLPLLGGLVSIQNKKGVTQFNPKLHPIGCGPYKFVDWVQGDHITLQKWDKYFKKGSPHVDQIIFRAIGDDSVRLTGLQTGELDWIQRVPPQQVASLTGNSALSSSPARPYNPDLIMFNCTKPPFNDVRVRQAVAWAIDRNEIAKLVWFGTAVPSTEPNARPSPWYTGVNPYAGGPNLDKAQALLRAAGVKDRLQVNFAGQPQVATQIAEAQVMQSQLKKIGIDLNIERFAPAQWFEQLATKKYDMTSTYFSATYDPAFFWGNVTRTGGSFNFVGYSNKQSDALIDRFLYEPDDGRRKAIYRQLVRRMANEAPVLFLTNEVQRYWTKSNFHGPTPLPTLEIRAEEMWHKS